MNNSGQIKNDISKKRKAECTIERQNDDNFQVKFSKIEHFERGIAETKKSLQNKPNLKENTQVISGATNKANDVQNEGNIYNESDDSSDSESLEEYESDEFNNQLSDEAHKLGYAACIRETFLFLDRCGIPENDPIYVHLKNRLLEPTDRV